MKTNHILHLYHRIGFGLQPQEIKALQTKEKAEVIHDIFQASKKITPLYIDTSFADRLSSEDIKNKKRRKELMKISRKKVKELNGIWIDRLNKPSEILREKMTLFWANHFVCEDKNILHVLQYNNTLRKYALGDFRAFVKAISKEAAMLKYLNNKQNKKDSPNENFARELLELFTLGQGNYTETDIKEAARAFTGYNHDFKGNFKLRKRKHDYNEKTFLGETGNFFGDDIIDIVLSKKQCARFICKKIYSYFVNDKIDNDKIEELTTIFFTDYNIENLMKHILSSDWFYDETNIGTKIKSPIELIVGTHHIVPFTFQKEKQELLIQKLLGQILLSPPNVAGWKGGQNWIDSNTIVTRLRLASVLLNNAEITYSDKDDFKAVITDFKKRKRKRKTFIKTTTDWENFEKKYSNISNVELVDVLITAPISIGTKELLKQYYKLPKKEFCIQLLSLPEFQLC
ncbi:DUF1800 domain-containing protein [Tenacibaculum jejuense]|uniref:DUF1800 domain-containing protein n=1 Tax=Tenacibaculum jejuense TaxID=584609 RepID=A0A238U4B0_9FLAO|nr:DUF1800 domain-containing protein [Tenacibaculum jejuense]SNR14049.1 conserved protein of unknown function [Tenacibaculum jejuense]